MKVHALRLRNSTLWRARALLKRDLRVHDTTVESMTPPTFTVLLLQFCFNAKKKKTHQRSSVHMINDTIQNQTWKKNTSIDFNS